MTFHDLLTSSRRQHTIVTATRYVGCVEGRAQAGWLELQETLPGFVAAIGPTCSDDVADVSGAEWRESHGGRAVVISHASTATSIADEVCFSNVARSVATDFYPVSYTHLTLPTRA